MRAKLSNSLPPPPLKKTKTTLSKQLYTIPYLIKLFRQKTFSVCILFKLYNHCSQFLYNHLKKQEHQPSAAKVIIFCYPLCKENICVIIMLKCTSECTKLHI